jgi:hypothetical protein
MSEDPRYVGGKEKSFICQKKGIVGKRRVPRRRTEGDALETRVLSSGNSFQEGLFHFFSLASALSFLMYFVKASFFVVFFQHTMHYTTAATPKKEMNQ